MITAHIVPNPLRESLRGASHLLIGTRPAELLRESALLQVTGALIAELMASNDARWNWERSAGVLEFPGAPTARARTADPCVLVVFGASGNLAKRKLLPAIYSLRRARLLPDQFAILGLAQQTLSQQEFRQMIRDSICGRVEGEAADPTTCDWVSERARYLVADARDASRYDEIRQILADLDEEWHAPGNYLFYLATAPSLFADIVKHLADCGLASEEPGRWRRVVIEKPFGTDLASARELNREILKVLKESQIYRIDHYLGKETVQNILVFRFSNGIFEPVWNRRYVDHVEITVAECEGVEHRGPYYDHSGALRDMVPSHMMQLLSFAAMEPPISFQPDEVRDEQIKVLRAIQPLAPEEVLASAVRGQYDEGFIDGKPVPAYRAEPGVSPDSNTETFAALKLLIDNWRWAHVPFYLRTGKRLPRRVSEISIHFRQAPLVLFQDTSVDELMPNVLVIRIQPGEGISLRFGVKVPGPVVRVGSVNMDFRYVDYFGTQLSSGYERLLYDCMVGDATLFRRADMVEAGWSVITPVLDLWKALPPRSFPNYRAGTWGPAEAFQLVRRDGRNWFTV